MTATVLLSKCHYVDLRVHTVSRHCFGIIVSTFECTAMAYLQYHTQYLTFN